MDRFMREGWVERSTASAGVGLPSTWKSFVKFGPGSNADCVIAIATMACLSPRYHQHLEKRKRNGR